MFNLFFKGWLSAALVFLSLSAMNSSLMAWDCCDPCDCNRFYIGGFGGGIYSNSSKLTQMGTALFTAVKHGPLAVLAQGHTKKTSSGFGGAQIGYEWSQCFGCSDWNFAFAGEVETYFHSHKKKGHLINPTDRIPKHVFLDSFHMNTSVCLVNAILSLKNPCMCGFSPYVGGGIGAARISLQHAKSLQVSPEEPGINHFNSRRHDSSWAFAGQIKTGLRYEICQSLHIFGEYRYLFVDSSNYIFGSPIYPTHATTSPWNVKMENNHYNAFAVGFQYDL